MDKNDNDESDVFDLIEGLTPVDPADLEEFEKAMADKVLEIVKVVEERRLQAAESRNWQLKC